MDDRQDDPAITAGVSTTYFPVRTLGPGRRLAIWFQGCSLACRGCMSRHTWDPQGGARVPVRSLLDQWREAVAEGADGLTVSGGEPVEQQAALAALLDGAALIRDEAAALGGLAEHEKADILLYTGFTLAELDAGQRAAIRSADVLVTGRFEAVRPTDLVWRGSANQEMLPRTDLGRYRYAEHVERTLADARLQFVEEDESLRIFGVPARGELAAVERRLRPYGMTFENVSWRS